MMLGMSNSQPLMTISRAKCDFMITKQESNYRVFADICVVYSNVTGNDVATKKLKTAYAAEELKFRRYCDNYK